MGKVGAFRRKLEPVGGGFFSWLRRREWAFVDRALFGERMRRNFRGDAAVMQDFCDSALGDYCSNQFCRCDIKGGIEYIDTLGRDLFAAELEQFTPRALLDRDLRAAGAIQINR